MTYDDGRVRSMGERQTESRLPVSGSGATLRVLREDGVSHHVLPAKGTMTIGREATCDVCIPNDPLVSRRHAVIRVAERTSLVDLGSANGTRVTRLGKGPLQPHMPHLLADDDVIAVGGTYLVLETEAPVETGVRQRPRLAAADETDAVVVEGALARLRPMLESFAAGSIPVLVLGETGTGKDVVASMLHRLSPRAAAPFVCLNCAALPEALLESELFGYERGAFTGATQAKAGILESAAEGTVFLDEVGEMPLAVQAKLLRVLDQREVLRLGATRPRPIDVRFVAATNRNLEVEVAAGRFRSDLYFRLAAAALVVPALRDRAAEIAPLARRFAARAARDLGWDATPGFEPAAIAQLEAQRWPGNVRELKNAVERAVLLARGQTIGLEHLPARSSFSSAPIEATETLRPSDLAQRMQGLPAQMEKVQILDTLARCEGNQTLAAKELGMSRRTLVARLSAYGLTRKRRPD